MKLPLKTKLKVSLQGIMFVLKKPQYALIAFVSGFAISGLIIWSLNYELLVYIFTETQIAFTEKLSFLLLDMNRFLLRIVVFSQSVCLYSLLYLVSIRQLLSIL